MHHALRPRTGYNVWVLLIGSKQIRHGCEMRDSFYTKSRALHFYEPLTTLTLKAGFHFEIRNYFHCITKINRDKCGLWSTRERLLDLAECNYLFTK